MKRYLLGAGGLALVLVAGVVWRYPIGTTTVHLSEPSMEKAYLDERATFIGVGKFTEPKTYVDRNGSEPVVMTSWNFEPTKVYRGTTGREVRVVVIGGTYGWMTVDVEDAPKLAEGMEALVYLTEGDKQGTYIPLSLIQGMFTKAGDRFVAKNGAERKLDSLGLKD